MEADQEVVDTWTRSVLDFDDALKHGVELAVARKTRCPHCGGQLRPFRQAAIGPGSWKCYRCGGEQIVHLG